MNRSKTYPTENMSVNLTLMMISHIVDFEIKTYDNF